MRKKICIIAVLIGLGFISIPSITLARENQKTNWPLKEGEVENILDIIRKQPLARANFDLFNDALDDKIDAARKTGAVVLVKQAILKKQLDYWFKGKPKKLALEVVKISPQIIKILVFKDIGAVVEIIEKITVKKAKDYAMDWLTQKAIRIGAGQADYEFNSYNNHSQKFIVQYIIVYHPLTPSSGEIIAEFYSRKPIEPPEGKGGVSGPAKRADWINSTTWPRDRWELNERTRNNDGKLEPFILRVRGYVLRKPPPVLAMPGVNDFATYNWNKSKLEPIVEVDFDNPVPEIENSDIILKTTKKEMERNFWREKVKPLLEKAKSGGNSIKNFTLETIKKVRAKTAELAKKIKFLLQNLSFGGARIAGEINNLQLPPNNRSQLELEKLTKEALSLEEEIPKETQEKKTPEITKKKQNQSLAQLQEKLDDLSEKAEILSAQVQEFLPKEKLLIEKTKMPEEKAEKGEEKPEEPEELEKKPEEKLEKIPEKEITLCSISDTQYPTRNKIIFNEIAWMGNTNSANDEWMELKNISGQPIDLTNWQILDKAAIEGKSTSIKISLPNVTLLPGDFFLLERTDDNSVPGVPADLIYTGSIGNHNEALYLFDSQCRLQDLVRAAPDWPAGSNYSKKTMERTRSDLVKWQTSLNPGGTPKAENSIGEIILTGGGAAGASGGGGSGASQSPQPTLCSTPTTSSPSHFPIIFNEIAWMGTASSSYDEWIELKNLSTSTVSLNNWQIIGKKISEDEPSIKIFLPDKSIGHTTSTAYFLLEKNNSNPALENLRDIVYTGELLPNKNPNFELYLFNQNCELTDFIQATSSWPAGNKDERRTMERSQDLTWHTYFGDGENGIMGTPKAENSQPPANQSPIAQFTYSPQNPQVGQEIIFNAASSTDPDPDGEITAYLWNFGDGTTSSINQATTSHTFATSGQFRITLQVTDDKGATGSTSKTLNISQPKIADQIVISEVQIQNSEFIELYNPTNQPTSTIGWYLCYYSQDKEWTDPKTCWEFSTSSVIEANKHYLIGVSNYPTTTQSGYPKADWILLTKTNPHPYKKSQLANGDGAIGIFRCDPKIATTSTTTLEKAIEKSKTCKIDLVGWGNPKVKEGTAIGPSEEGKSLNRKKNEGGNYFDNDNNSIDFEISWPTPTNSKGETGNILPPEPVENFQVASSSDNTVTLTWSTTTDPDTPTSSISYNLYWSRQGEITSTTLNSTTTFSTTTTSTIITLKDLYYATYYFGIQAFDGLNFSALSTTTSYQIPSEIPQWQMFAQNPQRTFFVQAVGPATSTLKWSFDIPGGNIRSGVAIDQNKTIYLLTTYKLWALKEENNQPKIKWSFQPGGALFGNPLIGQDGTIYLTSTEGIFAVSPKGTLKWKLSLQPMANLTYPHKANLLNTSGKTLYLTGLFKVNEKTRPLLLALSSETGNLLWFFDLSEEKKYQNLNEFNPTQSTSTSPSLSAITQEGEVLVGFQSSLFSFDLQGNLKWKKMAETISDCQTFSESAIRNIFLDDDVIYFSVQGTKQTTGSCDPTCYNTLYALMKSSINTATSSITQAELRWQKQARFAQDNILFSPLTKTIYLNLLWTGGYACNTKKVFYSIKNDGTLNPVTLEGWSGDFFSPQVLDKNENIFGEYGNYNTLLRALILKENSYWSFRGNHNFLFPFALSKDGILYAPTAKTLFAFD
jgi:PKD repeat protein